jgi:predicted 2-oxoglutarate/Fe(II)-dependent dioxygenase YbiX
MPDTVTQLAPDIFTVADLFTDSECRDFIDRGESLGFEAASVTTTAGPQMMTNVRNNDRAIYSAPEFAASIWERVRQYAPAVIDGCRATGLNERFRFYRYDPGQCFKRHKDGSEKNPAGDKSRLTLLLYLNDGYMGGETIFSDYTFADGQKHVHEIKVAGRRRIGLFFPHERWHEGAAILSGRKYVLRTVVMYESPHADNR